jgi:hypothetical protein
MCENAPSTKSIANETACGDPEAALRRSGRRVSPGVTAGEDGVLRWVYEMNMWKNPTLVITIGKVFLLAAMAPALLVLILGIVEGQGLGPAFLLFLKVAGIVIGVVAGLLLLAYPLVAWLNGGKYCVVFEMDERGVNHVQMARQFDRNRTLAMVTALAGALAGNAQTAGAGLLAASRKSLYSDFGKVRRVVVNEARSVIYLNEALNRNQVYAAPADFAFVRDHIVRHAPKARVAYK